MNKWRFAEFAEGYGIGIVEDVEGNWHGVLWVPGRPLPPVDPSDEQGARFYAYEAMRQHLEQSRDDTPLPALDTLEWREEPTPLWVVELISRGVRGE